MKDLIQEELYTDYTKSPEIMVCSYSEVRDFRNLNSDVSG